MSRTAIVLRKWCSPCAAATPSADCPWCGQEVCAVCELVDWLDEGEEARTCRECQAAELAAEACEPGPEDED